MSLRRLVALMHGLGYVTTPSDGSTSRPRGAELSSRQDVHRFFGGALRRPGTAKTEGGDDS